MKNNLIFIITFIILLTLTYYFAEAQSEKTAELTQPDTSSIFKKESTQELAPRTSSEQMIISAYKKARNTVVNVNAVAGNVFNFNSAWTQGIGSGVIVDALEGYVITNYHVISGGQQIAVTLSNGKAYKVKLIGADADSDLALLKLLEVPEGLVAVEFGNSSQLEVGQQVLAIGNPFGLERTLTTGIISSLGRSIRAENGGLIDDLVQTDAAINPGNSGGPLLDTAGRIIGLNTAIVSRSGENSGVGFSIPINKIKTAIPQLIAYGRILRPKLGVVLANTDFGVVIVEVSKNSPASRAGLNGVTQYRHGRGAYLDVTEADFVVAVNQQKVITKNDVLDALSKLKAGQNLELTIRRGLDVGKLRTIEVVPELG
ncbi:MAG: trypsin-like peptidase domain-containing protein [Deltaproteobacteria bacterium]|jgi:S1-C subfamily serine protease|nr:trypsin-like peptidase domain-containing protein [Deltaproteobacteria bacterium]